jgi:hypothetical protein
MKNCKDCFGKTTFARAFSLCCTFEKVEIMSHLNISQYLNHLRWVLLGLILLSWIFSVAATAACTFLKVELFGSEIGVGFNAYDDPNEGCTTFGASENRNGPAYTFAVFNCLLTTLGVVGIFLMQFLLTRGRKRTWLALRIVMYMSMWCCMFTFYIQESETCDYYDCSLGGAGITQVFNVLMLIAISVMLFLTPFGEDNGMNANQKTQASEEHDENVSATEFEKETHLPDGSIQREIETTNPDGSKTITTTTEKPSSEDKGDFMIASDEYSSSNGDEDSSSSDNEEPSPGRSAKF